MDDLQGRHPPADDAVLSRQVEGNDLRRVVFVLVFFNINLITGDSRQ